ncbi:N-6 DNA methylase [Halopenitus salinus]|uniref:N-6 DNA methylase n=1 Tax=Halopenitus salinus TaxID=1198295 RepID=A0ABD5UXA9_9EURY
MSHQRTLVTLIEDVGNAVAERIESETAISKNLRTWMVDFGLDAASNPEKTVCNLAAFNFLLKATLYRAYRKEGATLQVLSKDANIGAKFTEAWKETGDEAFRENPLDTLVDESNQDLFEPLLEARSVIEEHQTPTDGIGEIFEAIVEQPVRRKCGQFRTPPFVGRFMAEWAITSGDDVVLDPGIGAGVLTAQMYDVKTAASEKSRVEEMWGVDISELAIVMASTGLKLENGGGSPNFRHHDFMNTLVEGSNVRIDGQNTIVVPTVDAIVSNPPYSRSAALEEKRNQYNNIVDAEAGVSMWGQAPLFAYFFVHSAQFLSDGGRLAFITSSRFFDTVYGEDLRNFLLDRFAIRAFLFLELEEAVFEGTDVTPCITLLEKGSTNTDQNTAFVRVDEWPDNSAELIEAIENGKLGETNFGFVNQIRQGGLDPDQNWRRYVDHAEIDAVSGLTQFSELATIKRGIATGKNDYFCLTQAEVEEWGLNEEHLAKILRRTAGFNELEITTANWEAWRDRGDEVWLLYCYEDGEAIETVDDDALEAYHQYGREVGADESYLASNRNPWYAVDERDPPDIIATYMSKDGFRFIRNRASIRTLNNLHNILLPGFEDDEIDALLAYLNSSVADEITKRSGRKYSRGLHKIEPNELKDVPVIDTRDLPNTDIERLATVYRALRDAIRAGGEDIDSTTDMLNETVRDVLDLGTEPE